MIDNKIEPPSEEQDEQEEQGRIETAKANRLIALKKKTDEQLLEMRQLKEEMKPFVVKEPTKTRIGTVSFVEGGISKLLNKDKMRLVLMEKLHISREKADAIIDAGSTDKIVASYVKVTPV